MSYYHELLKEHFIEGKSIHKIAKQRRVSVLVISRDVSVAIKNKEAMNELKQTAGYSSIEVEPYGYVTEDEIMTSLKNTYETTIDQLKGSEGPKHFSPHIQVSRDRRDFHTRLKEELNQNKENGEDKLQ